MTDCCLCLGSFNGEDSLPRVPKNCDHTICMQCFVDNIKTNGKMKGKDILCHEPSCVECVTYRDIIKLPHSELFEEMMQSYLNLFEKSSPRRDRRLNYKEAFKASLIDLCPTCMNVYDDLDQSNNSSIRICLDCDSIYCKACRFCISNDFYEHYWELMKDPKEHEEIVGDHIKRCHKSPSKLMPIEQVKRIQINEKLILVQKLGKIHDKKTRKAALDDHEIKELIRNTNEKYQLEEGTIENIYLQIDKSILKTMGEPDFTEIIKDCPNISKSTKILLEKIFEHGSYTLKFSSFFLFLSVSIWSIPNIILAIKTSINIGTMKTPIVGIKGTGMLITKGFASTKIGLIGVSSVATSASTALKVIPSLAYSTIGTSLVTTEIATGASLMAVGGVIGTFVIVPVVFVGIHKISKKLPIKNI